MDNPQSKRKIKIVKDGPYLVSGGVPLKEQIITPQGDGYIYSEGRPLPQAQRYALCRCGRTKNPPFCDGAHAACGFDGSETASREPYGDRAEVTECDGLDLYDDGRCAFARFCHRDSGTAWDLAENSRDEFCREEAVKAAVECPAGRLEVRGKDGVPIEPSLEPEIVILQDPSRGASACIAVRGDIELEASDGHLYEHRNRMALCRCGRSANKPFCDAAHIAARFSDSE
ncbi:MAG TPA: CDGSH iron-sulfur domain-containing protein [Clostridiales bacterium]|nr:MAG: Iron-binding zinc finger CDGSH type [Firmicutes bacterium ADurb.Bin262]HOU09296.1 CDGSH iron-sulfur domain-containing protein [Clostridiales bacterium]HQK73434.1 CDGSH iron-sulfur domain-containing protein [Clostridiales bacterium]